MRRTRMKFSNFTNNKVLVLTTLTLLACSDAGLQPLPEEVIYVDDKLSISGEFCTSPAEETTSTPVLRTSSRIPPSTIET